MMSQEPEKPLSPGTSIQDPERSSAITCHHRVCIMCCGCSAAMFLIAITVFLGLVFTIFHDPVLTKNSLHLTGLDSFNSRGIGSNLTFEASLTVRNPNLAPFKIVDMLFTVYFHGLAVGEAAVMRRSVDVPARTSVGINASAIVTVDRMMENGGGMDQGILVFGSNTRISGFVRIGSVSRKRITLSRSCDLRVNVSSRFIQQQRCSA